MGFFDFLDNLSKNGYDSVEDYLNQTGQNYDDLPSFSENSNNDDDY